MYVCGMTVYDYCHLGHARVMVVFDMIARYLRNIGYDVHYVRNITDIDDKIIQRARENHESIDNLTQRYIHAMHEDATELGVLPVDQEPRATEHMPQIIHMIEKLLQSGHAYQADDGDICFDISRYPSYGQLSGKKPEELRAGIRVKTREGKDDPLDFVLWKRSKTNEPCWESPWGEGRPGWHIECSAMATHCLGESFDIHGGGQDLQFPHHENEIAQSECTSGKRFANFWVHNGFVRVKEEKMSKSLNNCFTLRETLQRYHGETVRFFILSSHYRSPLNYSIDHLDEAQASLSGLYTTLRDNTPDERPLPNPLPALLANYEKRFFSAMDDDFNTPRAIAVLHELENELKHPRHNSTLRATGMAQLKKMGGTLGLLQMEPQQYLQGSWDNDALGIIQGLIEKREHARAKKDFTTADHIRDKLNTMGVVLEDKTEGTVWRRQYTNEANPH